MKKRVLPIVVLILLLGTVLYWYYYHPGKRGHLVISGRVEGEEVLLSFNRSGTIVAMQGEEGMTVKKGRLLAVLDREELDLQLRDTELALRDALSRIERLTISKDLQFISIDTRIQQAGHGRDIAWQNLAMLQRGGRPEEIKAAYDQMQQAGVQEEKARLDYQRARQLYEERIITLNDLERARSIYEVAQRQTAIARERYTLTRKGEREERVRIARLQFQQAEKDLRLAREQQKQKRMLLEEVRQVQIAHKRLQVQRQLLRKKWSDSSLYSPAEGTILTKSRQVGENVTAGSTVYTMVDSRRLWVTSYLPETYLGKVRIGDTVQVRTDSYPRKFFPARLYYISDKAEFTPRNVQTTEERVKQVFRVKVHIDNSSGLFKLGMPVDILITPSP